MLASVLTSEYRGKTIVIRPDSVFQHGYEYSIVNNEKSVFSSGPYRTLIDAHLDAEDHIDVTYYIGELNPY